jgi:hypothetical protein
VTRNYRLRCGDRQNWLGAQPDWCIYPGWRQIYGNLAVPLGLPRESTGYWNASAPIFDFPFYSNHIVMTDIDGSKRFVNVEGPPTIAYGDAAPMFAVTDKLYVNNTVRTVYGRPAKRKDFDVMEITATVRLKRDVAVDNMPDLLPYLRVGGGDKTRVIRPGAEPRSVREAGGPLPPGTCVGNYVVLSEGLQLAGDRIGLPAPTRRPLTLPRGSEWTFRYLQLRGKTFWWRDRGSEKPLDPLLEKALQQMGFRGVTPYRFDLSQGSVKDIAWAVDMEAVDGGVAGKLVNAEGTELLYHPPLRVAGLSDGAPAAVWRPDRSHLEWFGVFDGVGYVTFDADKTVDFYCGNVVLCDPRLVVEIVAWDAEQARFRVHNPTGGAISSAFATSPVIPGRKAVDTQVDIPAGASMLMP